MINQRAVIAANRFAMGARLGDITAAQTDPHGWLLSQMTLPKFPGSFPHSREILRQHYIWRQGKKQNPDRMMENPNGKIYTRFSGDVISRTIESDHSLSWRLLDFFSNHFSVTARGGMMKPLAPTLEREAVAPNLYGQFEHMLQAVEKHPAMLVYLNNENSIGPGSRAGRRNKDKGLNENLAREFLELHTLGVNGGYNLDDIKQLAQAITGWSIIRRNRSGTVRSGTRGDGFVFNDNTHEPGARVVLGKRYAGDGVAQGESILADLARHPSTARHVSFKLARHFVSDNPPENLVNAMTGRWLDTEGNLKEVVATMIRHDDAWQLEQKKFKTPREFLISSCRALGLTSLSDRQLVNSLANLGQSPFGAGSPAGYDDVVSAWNGGDALLKRIDWCQQLTARKRLDEPPAGLAKGLLGSYLAKTTEQVVSRAESRRQGVALLLMSPEFLRR